MKINNLIAGLLAGVLMMGNLSAVCFAADNSPVSTEGAAGTEAVETAPAGTDGTAGDYYILSYICDTKTKLKI